MMGNQLGRQESADGQGKLGLTRQEEAGGLWEEGL